MIDYFDQQESGIDARLGEIAGAIQETMESYEVEVNGTVYPGRRFFIFIPYLLTVMESNPLRILADIQLILIKFTEESRFF